jgi:hypothetical protein
MAKKGSILFFLWILVFEVAYSQFSITGTIRDKDEVIPGAAIYLAGTKISSLTDNEGKFSLKNLPAGSYTLLVQVVGYLPFSQNVLIIDKSAEVFATLKEAPISLQEVVIKPDPNRLYNLQTFRKLFIGRTPNAEQCKILNIDVLKTNFDNSQGILTVQSDEFLIIENKALGYRIKYLLENFDYNFKTGLMFFAGYPFFEEMKGSKGKQKRWEKNRNIAYYGSSVHFFRSLYKGDISSEGFTLHKMITIPNHNRQPDSLINASVKRLTTGANAQNRITFTKGDSLSFWLNERKKPAKVNILNKAHVNIDTLVKFESTDLKTMSFADELFIAYTKEKEPPTYEHSGFSLNRAPEFNNYQISQLMRLEPKISFFKNGLTLYPRALINKGFWAFEKMADAVPNEFIPTKTVNDYK